MIFEPIHLILLLASARTAGALAANTSNRGRRDLPPRAEGGGALIGTLGQGTGDGPYYLTSRNHATSRDKTPQRHPAVNKVMIRNLLHF